LKDAAAAHFTFPSASDDGLSAGGLQLHVGPRTKKCVAPDLLSTLDRFEQESILLPA